MGHLVQMAGLTVQNFVSAAVGMAVAVALVRGFARAGTDRIGNFWVDLVRGMRPDPAAARRRRRARADRAGRRSRTFAPAPTSPRWPAARQTIARRPGRLPGGDQGAGHQRRRVLQRQLRAPVREPERAAPTCCEIFLLLLIPFCLTRTFGLMVGDTRQGCALLARDGRALGGLRPSAWSGPRPIPTARPRAPPVRRWRARRSASASPARRSSPTSTTGTSTGAVNSLHDSFTAARRRGHAAVNMMLGEVAPGGVGAGLYGMLVLAVVAVFIAGLMVGRTPEYLGKKIGPPRDEAASRCYHPHDAGCCVLTGAGARHACR